MVLFHYDKIILNKYTDYKKTNSEKLTIIDFNNFKLIGIEKLSKIFPFYFSKINQNYIKNILSKKKIKIIFSCIGDIFSLSNTTSILIYHKTKTLTCSKYYILLLGTHERFRKYGYGKIILDEFIEFIKKSEKNKIKNKKKIILKSLQSSLNFYLDYGFTQSDLKTNKLFYKYEPVSELNTNQHEILEYTIE